MEWCVNNLTTAVRPAAKAARVMMTALSKRKMWLRNIGIVWRMLLASPVECPSCYLSPSRSLEPASICLLYTISLRLHLTLYLTHSLHPPKPSLPPRRRIHSTISKKWAHNQFPRMISRYLHLCHNRHIHPP